MNRVFLKTTIRNFWHRKTYSGLNLSCMTFGLTCAVIAALYILNDFRYDRFHRHYDRLYLVQAYVTHFNGERFPKPVLSAALTDPLRNQSPEIEDLVRVTERSCSVVKGDKSFDVSGYYADKNFFSVFTFPLVEGTISGVLKDPNSVVLSESLAVRCFGSMDCVGKTLVMKDGERRTPYKITGVYRNVPPQSVMQFDFVLPFTRFLAENPWALDRGASSTQIWLLLRSDASKTAVEGKIKNRIKNEEANLNQELFLFPLKDMRLYGYAGGKRVWREMQNAVMVGVVGLIILLIACFNFINLSVSTNLHRYREAGIKRVAGATGRNIVFQFLGESFFLITISFVCATLLVHLLLPSLNAFVRADMTVWTTDIRVIVCFVGMILFTTVVSGVLPALYLASVNPVDVLKGRLVTDHSFSVFRQGLVVFQFAIPMVLMVCLLIVKKQHIFMRDFDLGVDKDRLIVLNNTPRVEQHEASFKSELLAIPGVNAVSFTNGIPTGSARVTGAVSWEGRDASEKPQFWCIHTDFDYNKVVKMHMVDGRFFSPSFPADSSNYVINDVAARLMKYDHPVGSTLEVDGKRGAVIGVIAGFHALDLRAPFVPVVIRMDRSCRHTILVGFASGSYASMCRKIKAVYERYEPEEMFRPVLFCDRTPSFNVEPLSNAIGVAFVVALLLACLGLFGLASFTAESRTKEIGIRKVNGATTKWVMRLLLTNYTKWLFVAFLVALPLAFFLGQLFLAVFRFHIPIPFWAFLVGPGVAGFIALATVGLQTWSVAARNPAQTMKHE